MKKLILFFLIIGLVFALITCNTAADGTILGEAGDEVIFNWGTPGTNGAPDNSPDYPGIMIKLADCTDVTGTLGDISLYGEVIIEASLYATKEDFEADPQVPIAQANGLGHFKILATGEWTSELFPQGNNMNANGNTSAIVPSGKTGTPVNVLVQTAIESGVGYIEIRKLTFKPRTDGVVLSKVYDNGSYLEVSGNTLTFNGATYNNHAAKFVFPGDWGTGDDLAGKTITFTFTIPDHICDPSGGSSTEDIDHQLNIQAAQDNGPSGKDKHYNGQDPSSHNDIGQVYIDNLETKDGTFTIDANKLIAASKATVSGNEGDAPFELDAVRIVNNGSTYQTNYRCKSYTLIITSVTISP